MAVRSIVPKGCLRRAPFRAAEAQPASVSTVAEGASVSSPPAPVRNVNPLDDPRWDADLAACPGATFFHSSAWARVLHSAYGYRPVYFVGSDESGARTLLPMMEVDSWLTGRRGIGLPFTDASAPLAPDSQAFRGLHEAALAHGKQRGWKYLECRGGRSLFGDVPASERFLGHRLDLTKGEAVLFSHFEKSTRGAIRKGEQSNLKIEFSRDLESVRAFHHLMCITRRRHGVPPQPFAFFASIQRHVLAQDQGWVVLARHNGIPIAGAVYVHFGKTAIYKYGASDSEFQHLRANNCVMWAVIKRFAADGLATLDFGRTAPDNEGLRKFKLGWGTTENPIEYVRQDLRTGQYAAAKPPSSGRLARVFQFLPDPIFRLIGAILYKHVA